jgi:hypothetical protein
MRPVTSQASSNSPGDWRSRAMPADTIKMPDPIMEPMMSMDESSRVSAFCGAAVVVPLAIELLVSIL